VNWYRIGFRLLLAAVIIAALFFYRWVISYLVAALLLSYILQPIISYLQRWRIPRWAGVISLYLILASLMAWITARLIPDLIAQANNLYQLLQHEEGLSVEMLLNIPFVYSISQYAKSIDASIPGLGLQAQFIGILESALQFLMGLPKLLLENYGSIIGAVSFIFTIPLISFFLLKDWHKLRRSAVQLSSNRYFELSVILINKIDEVVGSFLRAMLLEAIAVSIMASIALSIAGVSNPVLIGIFAGVANVIPYFGPFVGGALAVISVIFSGGSLINMLYAALSMYIVQVIDNNLVYPVVVGKAMKMHPLWVLLTVLAGGWYGGILWMFISVPLVYMVYQMMSVLYSNLKDFKII